MNTKKAKLDVLEAYKMTFGNVSATCIKANIARKTFYEWKEKDSKFKEAVEELDERNLDLAETKLLEAIRKGKTPELIFFLKTKGKKRGYVEKMDWSVQIERPLFEGINLDEPTPEKK